MSTLALSRLEERTRGVRDAGRKLLVAYVTGGVTDNWTDHVRAAVDAGADVVEIGLPFSDPMVDGPVVQQASDRALARGSTVDGLLAEVAGLDEGVPLVLMTYANPVLRRGAREFRAALAAAGVSGLIVPDVPIDHIEDLSGDEVDLILLASPATPSDRRAEIARRSRGFVYAVSLMGTTGASAGAVFPAAAGALVQELRAATDLPVLLGFGVASPADAAAAAGCADGVIVGSALVRRVLDGATPAQTGAYLQGLRAAVDGHVEAPNAPADQGTTGANGPADQGATGADGPADQGATGAQVRHDRRGSGAAHP